MPTEPTETKQTLDSDAPTPESPIETKQDAPHASPPPAHPSQPVQPTQKPRSRKKKAVTILVILAILGLLGLGAAGALYIEDKLSPNSSPSLSTANDGNTTITAEESSIAAVAEKVGPSVVSIVTQTRSNSFYGATANEAAGTGIIVSTDGYVMTNNHVIDGATQVSVVDSNGESYEDVSVIGRDPLNDIAFLKIKSDKTFTAASLGNSSTIRTGQQVVAIGNALGQYSNTVTSGIISGTGRPITASTSSGNTESLTDLIQTDASINPGNSGGPLVNMSGQVIGINTAIVEDANGIGFAIPINSTKGVLAGVLENGKVSRSYLGVSYLTITPDVAREHNLSVNSGAYVYTSADPSPVEANGPAGKAGIKEGDVITKINGKVVGSEGSLSSILGEYRPGDKITITYLRDGKEQTATVNLGSYRS